MLAKLRRALTLSRSDVRTLVRAFISVTLVDIGLRSCGFARVARFAAGKSERIQVPVDSEAFIRAARYARWIEVAAKHHLIPAHCLHRSLTLHAWLRREGLPSELRIGVRFQSGELNAHAWVELEGQPANELPERIQLFKPLLTPLGEVPDWRRIAGQDQVNSNATRPQRYRKDSPST